ncbi:MAG: hypothetical protein KA339_08355 [Candidatus Kapabacteria bacterium]|nr:hypothetical protein [Ignavibacteria bacterium]MBK6418904.1 hypothetical protein [Ignavibacteria bacterium]MBK7411810.1 hypothetical protein [Ignavibacteria bacterium]MBP6510557.1 hypothetical protein [Candidatus Kapabacteria bacterium]MBP7093469.1 hypothetical protein [Candidatus Kapabacteria bacterium]
MNNDVTTREFGMVLKTCGYFQADFARYIDRSPAFVHKLCINYDVPVPYRWVDQARLMVGAENFEAALIRARVVIESRRKK